MYYLKRLKELRESMNLRQHNLADVLDITKQQ